MTAGIPWLGFIVYPAHRRLKARNAVHPPAVWRALCRVAGASVQGWINHVRYAYTLGADGIMF